MLLDSLYAAFEHHQPAVVVNAVDGERLGHLVLAVTRIGVDHRHLLDHVERGVPVHELPDVGQPRHLARIGHPEEGGLGGRSGAGQPVVFRAVAAASVLPPAIHLYHVDDVAAQDRGLHLHLVQGAALHALLVREFGRALCLGTHVVDFIKPLHFRLDARDGDLFPLHRRGEAAERGAGGEFLHTAAAEYDFAHGVQREAVAVRLAGVLVFGGRLGDLGNVARDDPFVGIDRVDLCRGGEDAREKGEK